MATGCVNTTLDNIIWTGSGTYTVCLTGFAGAAAGAVGLVTNCRFVTSSDIIGLGPGTAVITSAVLNYEPTSGGTLSIIA